MGPLATRLTLEEAEMLAARVGHVVRTAVAVDQNAVQEIKKEKDKKDWFVEKHMTKLFWKGASTYIPGFDC